jgi:transcription elongation factor GreA
MTMLDELRSRLQRQIEELDRELRIELPQRIAAAVAMGDLSENAEYSSALERQDFVRVRLGQLTRRLSELSRIDLRDVPSDRVGFGSRVEAEDENGNRHAWRLVFPEFVELDGELISIASPLGRALIGSRPGDEVWFDTPEGERTFRIVGVVTLHGVAVSTVSDRG